MQASTAAWRVWVAEYAESRGALLGAVLLLGLLLLAVLAPWVAPQNPYDLAQLDILNAKLPPGQLSVEGMVFWLGTDEQGRLPGISQGSPRFSHRYSGATSSSTGATRCKSAWRTER